MPSSLVLSVGRSLTAWSALSIACLASSVPSQAQEAVESCGDHDVAQAATVEWLGLEDAESETTAPSLTVRVTNLLDVPADVRVGIVADAGGPETDTERGKSRELAPRGTLDVVVDPATMALPTSAMTHSGQLMAIVQVTPEGACDGKACSKPDERPSERALASVLGTGPVQLYSPPVYFHREGSSGPFLFYGEDVLRSRYAGGDLTGEFPLDDTASLQRSTDSGAGMPNTLKLQQESLLPPVGGEDNGGGLDPDTSIDGDEYVLCVKFEIGMVDAGKQILTKTGSRISEDHWSGWPAPTTGGLLKLAPKFNPNLIVAARGVAVSVNTSQGWSEFSYANSASGCVTVETDLPRPFDVRVYSSFRDKDLNYVKVSGADGLQFYWQTKVWPKIGKPAAIFVGDYTARATMTAVAGYSLYRWNYGNAGKTILVEESDFCGKANGAESSAHFDFSDLAAGTAHVRVHPNTIVGCSTFDHRRAKFIISHELGHAWLLLRTQQDEPTVITNLNDASETVCGTGDSYSLGSVEWSGVGFREGTAHLYATRVWNERQNEAVFSWFATPYDVESNNPDLAGGQIQNICTTSNTSGKSTNIDWLRFWWDSYSAFGADTIGSGNTIAQIYEDTIVNGGLTRENFWDKTRAAASQSIASSSILSRFDCAASWNGVANWNTPATCSIPTPP